MGFELAGMDDLLVRLQTMSEAGKPIEEKALKAGAEIFRDEIESNTPKSSLKHPHAKDFIAVGEVKDGAIPIGPDKKHWYLRYPEFGSSKQTAQGFIERSFNNKKDEVQALIARVIREELGL